MENQIQTAPTLCPHCGNQITPLDIFCPVCGTFLKDEPISLGKQIWVYLVSFFLPPFGLIWVKKYLKSPHESNRRAGWIIITLTIVSLIVSLWVGFGLISSVQTQINSYSSLGL